MSRHHDQELKTVADVKRCRDKRTDVATSGTTSEDCKRLEWMSRQEKRCRDLKSKQLKQQHVLTSGTTSSNCSNLKRTSRHQNRGRDMNHELGLFTLIHSKLPRD